MFDVAQHAVVSWHIPGIPHSEPSQNLYTPSTNGPMLVDPEKNKYGTFPLLTH